jgi:uncharacterized protein
MLKGLFSESPSFTKLFIIIFIILLSFLIVNAVGILMSFLIFKINFLTLTGIFQNINTLDHSNVNILKFLQIIQSLGLFVIPPVIVGFLLSNNVADYLRLNIKPNAGSFILALFIMLSCMPIIEWLAELNSRLQLPSQLHYIEAWMKSSENSAEVLTKTFLNVTTTKGLFLNIFMIAVIPAIGEEFLFRGILIRLFKEWTKNKHYAIIISAAIFSLIHFQFYGFIPRMMLGVLFGYLFIWSQSIWIPVFIHFLNNATAVISSYILSKGIIKTETDKMFDTGNNFIYLTIGIITTAIFIWLFYYYNQRNKDLRE